MAAMSWKFSRVGLCDGRYRCRLLFKGDFSVVVDASLLLSLLLNSDSCRSQLPALLQSCQPPTTEKRRTLISFLLVKVGLPATATGLKCVVISNLASSSCFSLAFLLAFLPWVLASRALASDNISNSSICLTEETDTLKSLLQVPYIACKIKQF